MIESKLRTEHSSEEKRKEHQRELAIALNEKAKERLAKQSSGKDSEKIRKSTVSYKSVSQMPRENEVKDLKLYVGKCNVCHIIAFILLGSIKDKGTFLLKTFLLLL